MKSVWLFVTILLVVTSADLVRPKRDVARIQNIIKWLLGINEGKLMQTVPLIENEQDRIYTLPAYQKHIVKTMPRVQMNTNIRHILTEGLYPGRVLRPVQPIRHFNPIIYNNNYPTAMRDYINDRAYGPYSYDRPMYLNVNQLPTYRETVQPLCPTSVAKLACSYATRAFVTEARPPLPQPPMYIQNRMRDVMLNRQIPTVHVQKDIVMPPPSQRRVDVSEYSVIDDRMAKNAQTPNHKQNPVKHENEQQVKSISKNKEVVETMPSWLQSESDAEGQLKTNENYPKKVSFSGPVQTKYKYKMIYHNQPDRNTVMEMDSLQAQTSNEDTTLLLANESIDQVKSPTPLMKSEDKVPADYIYIPPVNTEVPVPGAPRVNTNMKKDSNNYSAVASENRPVVSMDDSPFTNIENNKKPTRVVVRRRKIKSRPESSRGDIPDHS